MFKVSLDVTMFFKYSSNVLLFLISKLCKEILNDDFLFFIINTYSTNLPIVSLENILKLNFKNKKIIVDDLCLPIENSDLYLSCGITGRVTND